MTLLLRLVGGANPFLGSPFFTFKNANSSYQIIGAEMYKVFVMKVNHEHGLIGSDFTNGLIKQAPYHLYPSSHNAFISLIMQEATLLLLKSMNH